jgi:GAF domain-containing protein
MSRFAREESIVEFAFFPLYSGNDPAGLLMFNYRRACRFGREEQLRLQQIARRAALALRTAQLMHNARRQNDQLSALNEVSRELLTCESRAKSYEIALKRAQSVLGVQYANIIVPLADKRLRLEASYGWEKHFTVGHIHTPDEASHARYTIEGMKVIPVDDFGMPQPFPVATVIREEKIFSGIGIPMILDEGKVLGAMMLHTAERRLFDEGEIYFLSTLANQTASAMQRFNQRDEQNARTERQLEGRDRRLLVAAHQLNAPLQYLRLLLDWFVAGEFGACHRSSEIVVF